MIPLRDSAASRRFTPINAALIAANVAVFVHEVALGRGLPSFIDRYAMVPVRVASLLGATPALMRMPVDRLPVSPVETLVTSMFVHGGVMHLVGNMLYLFIFGAAVEEALGALRFAVFYL